MLATRSIALAVFVSFLAHVSSSVVAQENKIPADVQVILDKAKTLELFSIKPPRLPEDATEEEAFHRWELLGKTKVKEAKTRKAIVAAFKKGVEEHEGFVVKCFLPRHGIRVTHDDKTVDFVICFQCSQVQVFVDGKRVEGFYIAGSSKGTFDSVLKKAKIPLASEEKEEKE